MLLNEIELIRARWRRVRERLHMDDPERRDFGLGLLPGVASNTRARLLVLPPDPEGISIPFTDDLWAWWKEEQTDPHTGECTLFGLDATATSSAAIRYRNLGRDDECHRYLALRRDGGIEMGLGRDAIYTFGRGQGQEQVEVFRLTTIVGRTAAALERYRDAKLRLRLDGPCEVTLALIKTKDTLLGDVASGWAEATQYEHDHRRCHEQSVLLRREVTEWPEREGILELSHEIGAEMENAWGSTLRRFLARTGDAPAQFDAREYRWS